jgi:NADPH:quinone reductase-like Zn-dependent oxidoreductase
MARWSARPRRWPMVIRSARCWPSPTSAEPLLKVLACGLNNTDVNTRVGWYSKAVTDATSGDGFSEVSDDDPTWGGAPIQFPRIQGADVCAEVIEGPAELIGKRVITDNWIRDWSDPLNQNKMVYFGSERNGGFAQYTTIPDKNVGVLDVDLSDAELATFSCSYSTAEGMLSRAGVGEGDRVLITGASGGVGSALIQLAKRRGATTIALASEAKHDAIRDIGADVVLPRAPEDLRQALLDATGQDSVTVVADIVGGPYFGTLIDALARGGGYTCSGAIAGPMVELDLRTFYLNDLTFTGSTAIPPHIFDDLLGYIERGEVKPLLAATYPLSELHKAQQMFIDKAHVGNIVVIP